MQQLSKIQHRLLVPKLELQFSTSRDDEKLNERKGSFNYSKQHRAANAKRSTAK